MRIILFFLCGDDVQALYVRFSCSCARGSRELCYVYACLVGTCVSFMTPPWGITVTGSLSNYSEQYGKMSTVPGGSFSVFSLWINLSPFFFFPQHLSTSFSQCLVVWITFFPQYMGIVDIFLKSLQLLMLFDIIFLFSLWIVYLDNSIIHRMWITCGHFIQRCRKKYSHLVNFVEMSFSFLIILFFHMRIFINIYARSF